MAETVTAPTKRRSKTPSTHPLSHRVPDMVYAEEYVSRTISGHRDIDLLRYAKAATCNTMLFGPTGPGKTSLIFAYAATDNLPVVTIQCNGAIDPASFWGMMVVDETTGNLRWQDSEVTEVIRHGGVLYLDEVNFLLPKVSAVFHGLLDKRRSITITERNNEVVNAHPDLQVIVAYNPDYEGTRPLNPAFKNRFKIKVRLDYDEAVERELLCLPVMLQLAAKLRAAHAADDLDTPISTNMLIEFEEFAVDLGFDFAVNNFLNAFSEEERSAVTEVFDLHADEIRKELAVMEQMAKEGA